MSRRARSESIEDVVDRADDALADGDEAGARQALRQLPPAEGFPDQMLALDVADLWLALGEAKEAQGIYRKVTAIEPDWSDAWYGLGASAEELGDEDGKVAAWTVAHRLDGAVAPEDEAPDHLSEDEFADVAEAALGELPGRARDLLRDVPIVIVDRPSSEDVKAGVDPRLLGMFEGTPYPEAGPGGPVAQVARILLFRRNLELATLDADELRDEIRTTLLHETGHFFGLDEDDLGAVGLE